MRAALILWIGLGLLVGSVAKAQSFEDGYQSYMRNQFPVAELQFKGALKKAKAKEDMAFILKFIGICQYMRGDKNQAASTFYQALANDRGLAIDEEEVLDPSIINFFNFLKNKWAKEPMAAAPRPAAAKTSAATQPPPPTRGKTSLAAKSDTKNATAAKRRLARNDEPTFESPEPVEPKNRSKSSFSYWHLMPFGGGQFHNKSYWLGGGLALAQSYTLYKYFNLGSQISSRADLESKVEGNQAINDERKQEFYTENASFTKGLEKSQNLHLALFASFWIGGVVEAILNAPEPKDSASSAGRKLGGGTSLFAPPRDGLQGTWVPGQQGGTWLVQVQLSDPW